MAEYGAESGSQEPPAWVREFMEKHATPKPAAEPAPTPQPEPSQEPAGVEERAAAAETTAARAAVDENETEAERVTRQIAEYQSGLPPALRHVAPETIERYAPPEEAEVEPEPSVPPVTVTPEPKVDLAQRAFTKPVQPEGTVTVTGPTGEKISYPVVGGKVMTGVGSFPIEELQTKAGEQHFLEALYGPPSLTVTGPEGEKVVYAEEGKFELAGKTWTVEELATAEGQQRLEKALREEYERLYPPKLTVTGSIGERQFFVKEGKVTLPFGLGTFTLEELETPIGEQRFAEAYAKYEEKFYERKPEPGSYEEVIGVMEKPPPPAITVTGTGGKQFTFAVKEGKIQLPLGVGEFPYEKLETEKGMKEFGDVFAGYEEKFYGTPPATGSYEDIMMVPTKPPPESVTVTLGGESYALAVKEGKVKIPFGLGEFPYAELGTEKGKEWLGEVIPQYQEKLYERQPEPGSYEDIIGVAQPPPPPAVTVKHPSTGEEFSFPVRAGKVSLPSGEEFTLAELETKAGEQRFGEAFMGYYEGVYGPAPPSAVTVGLGGVESTFAVKEGKVVVPFGLGEFPYAELETEAGAQWLRTVVPQYQAKLYEKPPTPGSYEDIIGVAGPPEVTIKELEVPGLTGEIWKTRERAEQLNQLDPKLTADMLKGLGIYSVDPKTAVEYLAGRVGAYESWLGTVQPEKQQIPDVWGAGFELVGAPPARTVPWSSEEEKKAYSTLFGGLSPEQLEAGRPEGKIITPTTAPETFFLLEHPAYAIGAIQSEIEQGMIASWLLGKAEAKIAKKFPQLVKGEEYAETIAKGRTVTVGELGEQPGKVGRVTFWDTELKKGVKLPEKVAKGVEWHGIADVSMQDVRTGEELSRIAGWVEKTDLSLEDALRWIRQRPEKGGVFAEMPEAYEIGARAPTVERVISAEDIYTVGRQLEKPQTIGKAAYATAEKQVIYDIDETGKLVQRVVTKPVTGVADITTQKITTLTTQAPELMFPTKISEAGRVVTRLEERLLPYIDELTRQQTQFTSQIAATTGKEIPHAIFPGMAEMERVVVPVSEFAKVETQLAKAGVSPDLLEWIGKMKPEQGYIFIEQFTPGLHVGEEAGRLVVSGAGLRTAAPVRVTGYEVLRPTGLIGAVEEAGVGAGKAGFEGGKTAFTTIGTGTRGGQIIKVVPEQAMAGFKVEPVVLRTWTETTAAGARMAGVAALEAGKLAISVPREAPQLAVSAAPVPSIVAEKPVFQVGVSVPSWVPRVDVAVPSVVYPRVETLMGPQPWVELEPALRPTFILEPMKEPFIPVAPRLVPRLPELEKPVLRPAEVTRPGIGEFPIVKPSVAPAVGLKPWTMQPVVTTPITRQPVIETPGLREPTIATPKPGQPVIQVPKPVWGIRTVPIDITVDILTPPPPEWPTPPPPKWPPPPDGVGAPPPILPYPRAGKESWHIPLGKAYWYRLQRHPLKPPGMGVKPPARDRAWMPKEAEAWGAEAVEAVTGKHPAFKGMFGKPGGGFRLPWEPRRKSRSSIKLREKRKYKPRKKRKRR